MDTIYALASGAPPSGVAVVRVSGPSAIAVAKSITGTDNLTRQAKLLPIRFRNDELIDTGLVLAFSEPASFTGEDVVEFQLHGSLAVVRDLEQTLASFPDLRPALPGEFAQRAFINGKMDLTEAEGLADLIDAETSEQRRFALRQAQGETADLLDRWADDVLQIRALLEASIDFADEDDIASDVESAAEARVKKLIKEMQTHVSHSASVEAVRRGILVVFAGVPNAGKSSLFNALVGGERVIVSDVAGTTRDYVEERIDLDGYLVRLVDTAGLRETTDDIERQGVARSESMLDQADLVLEVSESGRFSHDPRHERQEVIRVASKQDISTEGVGGKGIVGVSVTESASIDDLRRSLVDHLKTIAAHGAPLVPVNVRQAALLRQCIAVLNAIDFDVDPVEVQADALMTANETLGHVVGRHDVEDVLGAVFSRFCIGK